MRNKAGINFQAVWGGCPQCRSICYTTLATICTNNAPTLTSFQPLSTISHQYQQISHLNIWTFKHLNIWTFEHLLYDLGHYLHQQRPNAEPFQPHVSISKSQQVFRSIDFFSPFSPPSTPFNHFTSVSANLTPLGYISVFFFHKWLMPGAVEEKAPQGGKHYRVTLSSRKKRWKKS